MADYTSGGNALYDLTTGDLALFDNTSIVVAEVTGGLDENGEFSVNEQITWNGLSFGDQYIGTATIDGHLMVVVQDSTNGTWFLPPAGVSGSAVSWPANISAITINPVSYALCFAKGTMIATPTGETTVEDLSVGDAVMTHSGLVVPVKWIGRQTVMTRFRPADRLGLVRIATGTLDGGLPHTDLTVTADHGMLVAGVICHAGALVNGTTITPVPLEEVGETYTVYHIETEDHEIILANGAPAETFIDNASRRAFDNYAEFEALYGDVPEMQELPYPRAMSARQVPVAIRAKLGIAKAA